MLRERFHFPGTRDYGALLVGLFSRLRPSVFPPDILLKEGDRIEGLTCIHLPGHTPGSIGLLDEESKTLFAGDLLRWDGTALSEGPRAFSMDVAASWKSIRKIASLEFDTLLIGHGKPLRPDAAAKVREFAGTLPAQSVTGSFVNTEICPGRFPVRRKRTDRFVSIEGSCRLRSPVFPCGVPVRFALSLTLSAGTRIEVVRHPAMNMQVVKWCVDLALGIAFLFNAVTGIIKLMVLWRIAGFSEIVLPVALISEVHDRAGLP